MTRDEALGALNEDFVVLATTVIRNLPTEVQLGAEDGMPRDCVLNADHVDVVAKSCLGERIATLSPEKLRAVCRALDIATGCG